MAESTYRDNTFFSWLFNFRMQMSVHVYLFDKHIRLWISKPKKKKKLFSCWIPTTLYNSLRFYFNKLLLWYRNTW